MDEPTARRKRINVVSLGLNFRPYTGHFCHCPGFLKPDDSPDDTHRKKANNAGGECLNTWESFYTFKRMMYQVNIVQKL